jgi:hypothetical protein
LKTKVRYDEDDSGTIRKTVPISDELGDQLAQHMDDLSIDLGRELSPEDAVFPDLPHFEHIEHGIVEAMKSSGVDPALVYAFEQTGLLVSEENRHLISPSDMAEWESAVSEYREQNPPAAIPEFVPRDDSVCWSCDQKLPKDAVRCLHCEAKVEDAPQPEDAAMLMELLGDMDPALMNEMRQMAMECETGDDFINRLMIGECPKCESDNTGNCENDPEIEDPCVGRCFDCGQLFCCDCEEQFVDQKVAVAHDCPMWQDDAETWEF